MRVTPPELRNPSPDANHKPAGKAGHAFMDRLELLITLVMDSIFVAAAIVSRGLLLRLFKWMLPSPDSGALLLHALEWVINIIIVFAALLIITFDMAKRVRNAYHDFKSSDR